MMKALPITFEGEETKVEIDKQFNCWDCKDTYELEKYTYDNVNHVWMWDGYQPCHCTKS